MENQTKIAIDLDNVVVATTQAVLNYINARLPISLAIEDIKEYWMEQFLPEQFRWIVSSAFTDKEMWKTIELVAGAKYWINRLFQEGYEIYFATSSLPENLDKKIKHLKRNLDIPNEYIENHTINIHKKQLLNVDIMIDDCLDNLLGKRSYKSICLEYPWNRNKVVENDKFSYAKDWIEIYEIITGKKACG